MIVAAPVRAGSARHREPRVSTGTNGLAGHNPALQPATRLAKDTVDNYGRLRKKGSAVPEREDFNTLDNPFSRSTQAGFVTPDAPGTHVLAFLPASRLFHRARRAMDGVLPDRTNFRAAPGRPTVRPRSTDLHSRPSAASRTVRG